MVSKYNILMIMVDQLAVSSLPIYGHPFVKTPNLTKLASKGVVFDSAYCNFPICSPSRASMLSGRLPHSISAFDNASEFSASIPTLAHYLNNVGYKTILCGKMHFIGPDQLHGYQQRLTTDIYPADFSWTPDWSKGPSFRPTGVSMRPVLEAGPCIRSLQIDYDDEVAYKGSQCLYDLARFKNDSPFFLTVSFTHPHPPFVSSQRHWDLYENQVMDAPLVSPIPFDELDQHSQWLYIAHAQDLYSVSEEQVLRARRAYYGMVSYVDEKIGAILDTLAETNLDKNTMVVFCGDHGEMLGERGMWFKQTFYEQSVRVPMVISMPGKFSPNRISAHVSLVDLLPTLMDFACDGNPPAPVGPLDGKSLVSLMHNEKSDAENFIISEYSSEGVCAASRMIRKGSWKYIYTYGLPPMLFDLESDPAELKNLAGEVAFSQIQLLLHDQLTSDWNPESINLKILNSQRERLFLSDLSSRIPNSPNWTYQPFVDESKRFIRGSGSAGPTTVKSLSRFPYVAPVSQDKELKKNE